MSDRRGRPKGMMLDTRREEVRASLARTMRISTTAQELGIRDLTLRNYLRKHPELYPKDFKLQPRGVLSDVPHDQITELLRHYTVAAAAEQLGVKKGILESILRRHRALLPPEATDPNYKKQLKKKERVKHRPELKEGPMNAKINVPTGNQLMVSYRTLVLLEKRLKEGWDLLPGEYFILLLLSENVQPLESGVLADTLGLTRSGASRYLSGLDKKKLVRFAVGKEDKRTMVYAISPEGSALITKVAKSLADKPQR